MAQLTSQAEGGRHWKTLRAQDPLIVVYFFSNNFRCVLTMSWTVSPPGTTLPCIAGMRGRQGPASPDTRRLNLSLL